jgi:hypothetical protein
MPATDAKDEPLTRDWDFPYASVPDPEADADVDPHWLSLRGGSTLPAVYLPPAMAGEHAPWLRVMAFVLIAVFVAATAAGICLTYGPPSHLW